MGALPGWAGEEVVDGFEAFFEFPDSLDDLAPVANDHGARDGENDECGQV